MMNRFSLKLLLLVLVSGLSWHVSSRATTTAEQRPASSEVAIGTNAIAPVTPTPVEGRIAFITARMLEQLNYLRHPLDDALSSRFLDFYLESLDPQHLHFTQADLADFEKYRKTLDDLTITRRGVSDTSPACEIYNRFAIRLQQRVAYAQDLLQHESFTFDGSDRIAMSRDDAPYPKDLEEAHKLWRERVRFEYLQELLGKMAIKKKTDKTGTSESGVTTPKTNQTETGTTVAEEPKPAEKPKSDHDQIVETLVHRYQRNLKTFKDFDSEDVLQIYLTALAHSYDPHSDYLGKAQLAQFEIGMNLSLFGIGAELRAEDGYCTINRLLPGGPALKSGSIKEKDRIVAVAQGNSTPVDVVDMNLTKAVQLIRGPKGTEVRLTIIPAGAALSSRKVVKIVRDEIPLEDQAAKAQVIDTPRGRLGVIDLPSFYASFDASNSRSKSEAKSTTADVRKLLDKLKEEHVGGIILDLRRNGGGSLEEAIRLTGLFIGKGPVVQVRDSDGGVQVEGDKDGTVDYDGPLIVLTSRFSASASEILAGALQDYGRALIVGDSSTHGKGTVQSVNTLRPYMQMFNKNYTNEPGALKVTIKKFYRASGASTQLKGVVPDIVLPSVVSESKDFGESAMKNAMPWDPIQSAEYEHLNRVGPYLADLRKRSADRISQDQEYKYIQEDIAIFKKQQADKSLSLNLKERLKEKEESDARAKARDKERLSRPESPDKVYEITLKLADKPGLPPPVEKTNKLAKAEGKSSPSVGSDTNIALAGSSSTSGSGVGSALDELDEEKAPVVDAPMLEAQRILIDYIAALSKHNVASAGRLTADPEVDHGAQAGSVAR